MLLLIIHFWRNTIDGWLPIELYKEIATIHSNSKICFIYLQESINSGSFSFFKCWAYENVVGYGWAGKNDIGVATLLLMSIGNTINWVHLGCLGNTIGIKIGGNSIGILLIFKSQVVEAKNAFKTIILCFWSATSK